ncbi:hypothetical protein L2E82_06171 [Cichorium intybus]|uniref:Uncharacterized protein n=1 Tax=Cichorium intybus TaxID=13427 RepID=A0ACB9HAM7_CICIN|nr:hypothetical protein L2E82_06171 [Cichorium intybus]
MNVVGKRFRIARFIGLKDAATMKDRLWGIWIGPLKLRVKLTSYVRKEILSKRNDTNGKARSNDVPNLKSVVDTPCRLNNVVVPRNEMNKNMRMFFEVVKIVSPMTSVKAENDTRSKHVEYVGEQRNMEGFIENVEKWCRCDSGIFLGDQESRGSDSTRKVPPWSIK